MTRKAEVVTLATILVTILLYVGSYVLLRAAGFYRWWHVGITRNYSPHDPRLKGVHEYDLVTQTRPGWGFVHGIKPFFAPVSWVEHRVFTAGRSGMTAEGTGVRRGESSE